MRHEFEERDDEHLRLDTATLTPAELVERCEATTRAIARANAAHL